MSANIILTGLLNDPFARVSKKVLDDPNISFKAKGIIAYLIGKPPTWKLRVSDLMNHGRDGRDGIRSALNELRAAGYASYEQPTIKGVFDSGVWKISDSPIFSPQPEKPDAEKPHLSKNDCSKTETIKLRLKETRASSRPSSEDQKTPKETPNFKATWKPSERSKDEMLAAIEPPDYPTQDEFDSYIDQSTDHIASYRPDLYLTLCRDKWHQWKPKLNRWVKIRDWKAYVDALENRIESSMTGK